MGTKDRFVEYLKFKGVGQTAFEISAGLSRGAISQKSGFSATSVEKIALACPDLNLDWLITGVGSMLKPPTTGINNHVEGDFVGGTYIGGNNSVNGNGNVVGGVNDPGNAKNKAPKPSASSDNNEIFYLRNENKQLREQVEKLKNDLLEEKERLIKMILDKK